MTTENEDIAKLYLALQEQEEKPNVLTRAQFKQFEPIFRQNHGMSEDQIKIMTQKYVQMVDFYKETVIIESAVDRTVVLKLPAVFTPFRSLSPTPQNDQLSAINAKMAGSGVPYYSSTAFSNMMRALLAEQKENNATIEVYREAYTKSATAFFDLYAHKQQLDTAAVKVEPVAKQVFDNTAWSFDE